MVSSPDLAVSLGLIVGAAVPNALKHAFRWQVRVALCAVGSGTIRLRVEDGRAGMSAERRAG